MKEWLGDEVYGLIEWARDNNREALIIAFTIVSTVYLADSADRGLRGAIVLVAMVCLSVFVGLTNYLDGLDEGEGRGDNRCGQSCYEWCFGDAGERLFSAVTMLDRDCELVCKPTKDEAPM